VIEIKSSKNSTITQAIRIQIMYVCMVPQIRFLLFSLAQIRRFRSNNRLYGIFTSVIGPLESQSLGA